MSRGLLWNVLDAEDMALAICAEFWHALYWWPAPDSWHVEPQSHDLSSASRVWAGSRAQSSGMLVLHRFS